MPVRKSVYYAQNFLKRSDLIASLIKKSSLCPSDLVYEIGPGRGIITEQLAKFCQKVVAIEADASLLKQLRRKFASNPKIAFVLADFLSYPLPRYPYKIFANPPFNITADLVRKITETSFSLIDAYLIMQKEAARKFAGQPYGQEALFSLLLKPWFEVSFVHYFSRGDFFPRPKVDVILLRLQKRKIPLIKAQAARFFKDFLVFSFSHQKLPTKVSFSVWFKRFQAFQTPADYYLRRQVAGSFARLCHQQAQLQKIHRTRLDPRWRKNRPLVLK